ncbi:LLM class flavin-dependent oxidoreductase [Cryptosporangium phraense]|uniref:LLM class flavin-dependent oxidoreductase n=1 Tax=Cryptosporangium phraense TaxID=2593070 RepID=A0A545AI70_9ACTN|nr:LLM class flavin-dependent oxidoreductase [Cryptosporangium phraense]TQS40960.1 LLM class flavin-dependent oxidoreductase [Cryptosporangium phraense]
MELGVILPRELDLAVAAAHAEDVGLDSVWHGDHLATGSPSLDPTVALAVAAAVTSRIRVGVSVFVPAIRPLALAAKQVASLQVVAGGRLVLGIGSGGGAAQFAAAGVPYRERGRRTDTALRLLPDLLAGRPVFLPDERAEVRLTPAVPRPPFWVGNASEVAIRRAATLGDGWFPSVIEADELAAGVRRLTELAGGGGLGGSGGRPVVAIGATGMLGDGGPTAAEIGARLSAAYGHAPERAAKIPITGSPAQAAERIAEYTRAGATHLVIGFAAGDWRRQCELLAEAGRLL